LNCSCLVSICEWSKVSMRKRLFPMPGEFGRRASCVRLALFGAGSVWKRELCIVSEAGEVERAVRLSNQALSPRLSTLRRQFERVALIGWERWPFQLLFGTAKLFPSARLGRRHSTASSFSERARLLQSRLVDQQAAEILLGPGISEVSSPREEATDVLHATIERVRESRPGMLPTVAVSCGSRVDIHG